LSKTYFFKFGSGDPRTNTGLAPTFLIFFDQTGATFAPPAISEGLTLTGFYKFAYTPTNALAFLIDGATTGLSPLDRYISGSLDPIQALDQPIGTTLSAIGSSLNALGSSLGTLGLSLNAFGGSFNTFGSSFNLFGASFNTLGSSLNIFGASFNTFGASFNTLGSSLNIFGASFNIMGTSISGLGSSIVAGFSSIGSITDSFGSTSADPTTVFGYLKRTLEFNEGNSTYTKATNVWSIYSRGSSTLLINKTLVDNSTQTTKT
jgi:hypothetical protein